MGVTGLRFLGWCFVLASLPILQARPGELFSFKFGNIWDEEGGGAASTKGPKISILGRNPLAALFGSGSSSSSSYVPQRDSPLGPGGDGPGPLNYPAKDANKPAQTGGDNSIAPIIGSTVISSGLSSGGSSASSPSSNAPGSSSSSGAGQGGSSGSSNNNDGSSPSSSGGGSNKKPYNDFLFPSSEGYKPGPPPGYIPHRPSTFTTTYKKKPSTTSYWKKPSIKVKIPPFITSWFNRGPPPRPKYTTSNKEHHSYVKHHFASGSEPKPQILGVGYRNANNNSPALSPLQQGYYTTYEPAAGEAPTVPTLASRPDLPFPSLTL